MAVHASVTTAAAVSRRDAVNTHTVDGVTRSNLCRFVYRRRNGRACAAEGRTLPGRAMDLSSYFAEQCTNKNALDLLVRLPDVCGKPLSALGVDIAAFRCNVVRDANSLRNAHRALNKKREAHQHCPGGRSAWDIKCELSQDYRVGLASVLPAPAASEASGPDSYAESTGPPRQPDNINIAPTTAHLSQNDALEGPRRSLRPRFAAEAGAGPVAPQLQTAGLHASKDVPATSRKRTRSNQSRVDSLLDGLQAAESARASAARQRDRAQKALGESKLALKTSKAQAESYLNLAREARRTVQFW